MGFLLGKKSKIGVFAQYFSIIFCTGLAIVSLLSLLGVFGGIPISLGILLLVSTSTVVISSLILRTLVVSRVSYRLHRYVSKNEFEKAERLIDKKIKSNFLGYKPNWLSLKAMVLIKKGELDSAESILDKLEKEHPNFLDMLYYRACLESIKANTERSTSYLNKIIDIQKQLIKETKSPFSKNIMKKRLKNIYWRIKNDEDLSDLHGANEFENLLVKKKKINNKLCIKISILTAFTISLTLAIIQWILYSKIYPIFIVAGFVATFVLTFIVNYISRLH